MKKRTRKPTKTSGTQYWGNNFADKGRGEWKAFSTKLPQEVKDQLWQLKQDYDVSSVNEVILAAIQLLINEKPEQINDLINQILSQKL